MYYVFISDWAKTQHVIIYLISCLMYVLPILFSTTQKSCLLLHFSLYVMPTNTPPNECNEACDNEVVKMGDVSLSF
jgi:hypothetical protein